MKVAAFFHGILYAGKYIVLKPTDGRDYTLIRRLFESKKSREERSGQEILLQCTVDAAFQHRSFKQLGAVWTLVTAIFESMEGRKPTEGEKYDLYLDLLDVYADKTPNRLKKDALRPVRISEANTVAAARFIDGLLYHLATECQLSVDAQAEVLEVLYAWEVWRGKQAADFLDGMTVAQWRERAKYSEASGRGGGVDCHHIVSRGAAPQFADCAWNVLALTREEHEFFHAYGWNVFLEKYPHLRGRVERAFEKAGHLPVPERTAQKMTDVQNLAGLAMEE